MNLKRIFAQLNIFAVCKRYGLPLWQCPQFLFLIMGTVNIATALTTYTIGIHYIADPNEVSLIVLVLTIILFVITFSIVRNMEGLAEANRLKSEFISVVSHQLRSPLSNLKWVMELLMSGRLGEIQEEQVEYFKILKENTARMGELVSDLLTVSRIEQKRLPWHKIEFSLKDLIKDIISEFKPYADASNVKIIFEAPGSLSQIISDPSRIKLVIENFLDNSIRYTKEKGEVRIKLEARGENLLFEIKDTGVGIPKEDQKHIFQKFFRSGNILRHQTQGSGLGLYIAKSIIEMAGGKIGFESEENKGSTFWFTLPIK